MKLYEEDYTKKLSDEDETENRRLRDIASNVIRNSTPAPHISEYPKAVRHYSSLFPNNYIDTVELKDVEGLKKKLKDFKTLLDSKGVRECDILDFIRQHKAYFIITSLLNGHFDFGHHDVYLFPEFQLGNSYRADYLIIGKSSGGYNFVFVELEAPEGRITCADGSLGEAFRKGVKQLDEWRRWLDGHYSSLKQTFDKSKLADTALPDEFVTMDRSRLHFVVICGRHGNFKDTTYQTRREFSKKDNYLLLHYDNLYDAAARVIGGTTY